MTTAYQDAADDQLESGKCAKVCVLECSWASDERAAHSHATAEHQKERRDRHRDRVQPELIGQ